MKPIELYDISRYRKPLMGMAIIFVMLFHCHMNRTYFMCSVKNMGNMGVDIFMFLSGIGLWFSWSRNPSFTYFYSRRIWRIYPEYFVMACLLYIPDYFQPAPLHSHDVAELIFNICINLCFWTRGDNAYWFIPAIMALYVIAPFYMNMIRRHEICRWMPVVFILFSFLLQYNMPLHQAFNHLEIFISRIPIFLIGLNCGQAVLEKRQLRPSSFYLVLIIFVVSFSVCLNFAMRSLGSYPMFLMRMAYIPLSLSTVFLLCKLFSVTPPCLVSVATFVGGVSLEAYLLHEHFVLAPIVNEDLGYILSALISLPAAILLGWVLHQLCHPSALTGLLPKSK